MPALTEPYPVNQIPDDVTRWYHKRFFEASLPRRLLGRLVGKALRDPKIFAVLKPTPAYRFAAIDAWRRMMWHANGLKRQTREAIAVAVSIANQCVY